jgi:predicted naringenin-chalcone synthase
VLRRIRKAKRLPLAAAHINAIGTAVPAYDVHGAFIGWAERQLPGRREKIMFRRMARRAGIGHRWSVLPPTPDGGSPVEPGGLYGSDESPSTSARMSIYAEAAPQLALAAIADLAQQTSIEGVTHLVVASCTGFVAPGLDQIVAAELGLDPGVERTFVGFMGCYAAVAALRVAHHIVRSELAARVLVVTVELSTLHLQFTSEIEPLLAMLQFGDGAAAALVTAEVSGFAILNQFAASLEGTADLIRWTIGDSGFAMHLSGQVPAEIAQALIEGELRSRMFGDLSAGSIDAWAVHAGGRSILDAVETALNLPPDALQESREVLGRFGNMSSSTLMFVLAAMLDNPDRRTGVALAFGPGLAAEGFRFARTHSQSRAAVAL